MKNKSPKDTLLNKDASALLAGFPPETQNLSLATRNFVLKTIPGITETVDTKSRLIAYGYGPRYIDMVCVIMPTKAGVTFGIGYAAQLPDPHKILEGAGKVHRHVKLKSKLDLKNEALKTLLCAANSAAMTRRENTDSKPSQPTKKKSTRKATCK
jgi:hypothetical protein